MLRDCYQRYEQCSRSVPSIRTVDRGVATDAVCPILNGAIFFVVWVGLGTLFGELSLIAAVFGALTFAGVFYWFDPR